MAEKRFILPSILDEPIKVFMFDFEDGMAFMATLFFFEVFLNNGLIGFTIGIFVAIGLSKWKEGKPRGVIIRFIYRFTPITFPFKYVGKEKKINP